MFGTVSFLLPGEMNSSVAVFWTRFLQGKKYKLYGAKEQIIFLIPFPEL